MHQKSHQQSQWSAGTISTSPSKKPRALSGVSDPLLPVSYADTYGNDHICHIDWAEKELFAMRPVQCSYKQKRHCCILNRISNNSKAWFRISYWQFSIEFLNSQFSVQLQMTEAEYYVSIADFLWYPRLYDRDSKHIWLGKTSESIRSLDDKCWWWIPLSAPGWGHVETPTGLWHDKCWYWRRPICSPLLNMNLSSSSTLHISM